MRVLIVSQFFQPEAVAASHRMHSFARHLADRGHEVVVIAEKPNHPEGVIWPEYRGGLFARRTVDGIPVVYTWVAVRPTKSFLTRILFYVSFMVMAVLAAFRVRGRFDVVLATSPPLFVGLSGWAVSRLKRARFVFDVRDVWPDLAVAMGELTRPRFIRLAKRMEAFIYNRADGIAATTRGFCAHVSRMAGPDTPVAHVPNGTVTSFFERDAERQAFRERLGMEGRFAVVYAGNVGICQGLAHLLDAAELLRTRAPEVLLVIVGGGPVREDLMEAAGERELDNVRFVPPVGRGEAAAYMVAADALLVPLADHPIYDMFIPSKLFDAMASARPVLLAVDGEAREVLEAAGAGRYYPPEDGVALAREIDWMRRNGDALDDMGRRGRAYVREHFSRHRQARRLEDFLLDLVGPTRDTAAPHTRAEVNV